jgi:hypothetical protein
MEELKITIADLPFQFNNSNENAQSFRFIPLNEIKASLFTLAIDRCVAVLLKDQHQNI